jgi:hypothetical protein
MSSGEGEVADADALEVSKSPVLCNASEHNSEHMSCVLPTYGYSHGLSRRKLPGTSTLRSCLPGGILE